MHHVGSVREAQLATFVGAKKQKESWRLEKPQWTNANAKRRPNTILNISPSNAIILVPTSCGWNLWFYRQPLLLIREDYWGFEAKTLVCWAFGMIFLTTWAKTIHSMIHCDWRSIFILSFGLKLSSVWDSQMVAFCIQVQSRCHFQEAKTQRGDSRFGNWITYMFL